MQNEPTSIKLDNIDDFLRRLDAQREKGSAVVLDLEHTRSIERPAASILSTALLSRWGDARLVVRLPPERLKVNGLSNLAFAFANRAGETEVEGVGDLSPWRRSWSPGARRQIGLLFTPTELGETEDEPSIFGRYHASFVNPHRAAPPTGSTAVTQVVRPWLTDVLPAYLSAQRDRRADPAFVDTVGTVINELLENVREHAPRERLDGGDSTRSLVQVAITRGGKDSHDRLYVIVLDTGPGLTATVRPKLGSRVESMRDADLVRALLLGDLAGWHRARGAGLPEVWRKVRKWSGAALQIASNTVRVGCEKGNIAFAREDGFHVKGTVIVVIFPMPPSALH